MSRVRTVIACCFLSVLAACEDDAGPPSAYCQGGEQALVTKEACSVAEECEVRTFGGRKYYCAYQQGYADAGNDEDGGADGGDAGADGGESDAGD